MTPLEAAAVDHKKTQLAVKIDGGELASEVIGELRDVRVDLGVRTIGRATLTFSSIGHGLLGQAAALDKDVVISSVDPAMDVFTGTITGIEIDADLDGTNVTLTAQDRAYKLSRNRDVATFVNQRYEEVMMNIAQAAGLQSDIASVTREPLDWLLQADSQLGLIDEIAGRLGFDWAMSGTTLAAWPVAEGASWGQRERALELTRELQSFSVRQSETGNTNFIVRGWDPQQKATVSSSVASEPVRSRDGFSPPRGTPATVLAAHQVSTSVGETELVAKGLAAGAGRISGRGRAVFVPELRPGGVVRIQGVAGANGIYYVREVSHQVDRRSLRTTFVVGDRAPVQLSDPWQAPAPFSSLRHTGVTVGVVDNLQDPDELGRVRVQLAGLSDQASSHWARVLSLGGGAQRGLVIMPEINDEVLVAFEEDDVRRPVVIGGLFGSRVRPAGPASVSNGAVVSRHLVSGKGHRLELADGPAASKEHIQLVLADGENLLRIGKDKSELKAQQKPLTISSGDASISFDGRGNITIKATSLTLKADQALKLEGMQVVAKATTNFEASGGVKAVLSGTAQSIVKSGALVEISGMPVKIN